MRPPAASSFDTIVAPATPEGRSALAVVRMSGPGAAAILRRLSPELDADPKPRAARLLRIRDAAGREIDRAVVTFFPGPGSYTGEDVVEISLHGNPVLLARLIAAAREAGARLAGPGEFTRRAFLNGRLDLAQAEAVAELIEARTEEAARAALARASGAATREVGALREELLAAHALATAALDFPEEAGEAEGVRLAGLLSRAAGRAEELAQKGEAARRLHRGARVAIVGPANAGKSTIFNALVGFPRAIVTAEPGTTRDTVEEEVALGGLAVRLVDTAGLREAPGEAEAAGIVRARAEADGADLVVFVREAGRPWTGSERLAFAGIPPERRLLVSNKADLAPAAEGEALCALSAEAPERLRRLLREALAPRFDPERGVGAASARQGDLLRRAAEECGRAAAAFSGEAPLEIAVTHLEEALAQLADLAGETTPEDVLDRIFSAFCIGK